MGFSKPQMNLDRDSGNQSATDLPQSPPGDFPALQSKRGKRPKPVSPPLGGSCVLKTHLLFTGKDPEGCGHRRRPGILQKACLWLRWAMGQAGSDSATPGKEPVVWTTPAPNSPWRLGLSIEKFLFQ